MRRILAIVFGLTVVGAGHGAPPAAPGEQPAAVAPVVSYRDDRVTLKAQEAPVTDIIEAIRRDSGAVIKGTVPTGRKVTAEFEAVPTAEALERILGNQNFTLTYADKDLKVIELKSDAEEKREVPIVQEEGAIQRSPSDLAPPGWSKLLALFAGKEIPIDGKLALLHGSEKASWDQIIQAGFALDDPALRTAAIKAGLKAFEADRELRDSVFEATAGMSDQDIAVFVRAFCRETGEKYLRAIARLTTDQELRARVNAVAARARAERLAGKPLPFGKMPPKGQRH